MSKVLTAVTLVLALTLPAAGLGVGSALAASPASHSARIAHQVDQTKPPPPAHNACEKVSYSGGVWVKTTIPNCFVVPPSGVVNTTICGVHFVGTAAPGSAITCQILPLLVTLPCSTETGVSLSIQGTDLHLTVPGARIYKFDPSTGLSTLVSAVTGSGGEYTFVFGNCAVSPIVLPKTGAAAGLGGPLAPDGPSLPLLPIGFGIMLVLLGAAMTVRTRKSQV